MKKPIALAIASTLFCCASARADTALQNAEIEFVLKAGATPISCSSPAVELGKNATSSRLRDARFYLHNLKLLQADGGEQDLLLAQNDWQFQNVALIDFEDGSGNCDGSKEINTRVRGTAPAGKYVGIRFDVGVPVSVTDNTGKTISLNHSNTETAPPPLDIQSMAWNWQAGRKFMKIEVLPEGGIKRAKDSTKVWTIHLGSTGCAGNPAKDESVTCTNPNHVPVRFERFDPDREVVVLDLAQLFARSVLNKDDGGASGCMSSPQDPECVGLFPQLGLRLTESAPKAGDGGRPLGLDTPPMFRKESK